MEYRTPGVFVEEVTLLPPSVAGVATAIPAFVGYTEVTQDSSGDSLLNRPIRITSLLEFSELFGGAYDPASYTIQVDPASNFRIVGITPLNGRRYFLFEAVNHYFDNGGGPCYIVTVGDYSADVTYGTDTTGLRGGVRALERVDEPTLLVVADTVALRLGDGSPDFAGAGNLHQDIIAQCGRLQDRFGILDMLDGHLPPAAPVSEFRNRVGNENLKYAAVYYPWLYTTYLKDVRFSQLNFVDNQAVPVAIPDATINTMTGEAALDGLVTTMRTRRAEEQRVFSKISQATLNRDNFNPLSDHLEGLRTAVMNASSDAGARTAFAALMSFVREFALAFRDLEDDAGNSAELSLLLTTLEADTDLRGELVNLIGFEKNAGVMSSILPARAAADVEADYSALDNEDWIGGVTVSSIAADGTDFTDGGANTVAETALAAANSTILQSAFDVIGDAFTLIAESSIFHSDQAESSLFGRHPFFASTYERVHKDMSLLPPSGAVAGVYAATDRSRGVWKAPANLSLRSVIASAYKLTDEEQGTLNVHESGKSVNAIRAFTGKGILVWGARTLAGNDNEWRYINVRRFFNFVEESTKKASEPFVFEPNNANTWIRVRAMIENFLTLQWRNGALAGATPKDAFFVKVGLGETMTALDILEGRMIVEIGMAAVRPAEFIILRFSHKMQES